MAQQKPTGILDEKFFETLEKYRKISEMTTDEGFKFYAPKFLQVGPEKRIEQVKAELGEINYKLGLLNDFKRNFDKYELEIAFDEPIFDTVIGKIIESTIDRLIDEMAGDNNV